MAVLTGTRGKVRLQPRDLSAKLGSLSQKKTLDQGSFITGELLFIFAILLRFAININNDKDPQPDKQGRFCRNSY